jgi:membrane-associated phospholipid phosphatase
VRKMSPIYLRTKSDPWIWNRFRNWCAYFALTIAAVLTSVKYLDQPISLLSERAFGRFTFFSNFTDTAGFFHPLALLVFAIFLFRRLAAKPFGKPDIACLVGDASLLLAEFASDKLKYFFGRTSPKYGDPSLIHDGVYAFDPFHVGSGFRSFPSGHAAAVCALLSVLWILYPRCRPLYSLTMIGLSAGLVLANFHFLGDVIAGAFLGASTGLACVSLSQWWERRFS